MKINISDLNGMRELLRQRIDSREWWIIAVRTRQGFELLKSIEERHYDGELSPDFEIIVAPTLTPIALAHKRQMSALELAKCVCEHGANPGLLKTLETDLLSRDLVIEDEARVEFAYLAGAVDG